MEATAQTPPALTRRILAQTQTTTTAIHNRRHPTTHLIQRQLMPTPIRNKQRPIPTTTLKIHRQPIPRQRPPRTSQNFRNRKHAPVLREKGCSLPKGGHPRSPCTGHFSQGRQKSKPINVRTGERVHDRRASKRPDEGNNPPEDERTPLRTNEQRSQPKNKITETDCPKGRTSYSCSSSAISRRNRSWAPSSASRSRTSPSVRYGDTKHTRSACNLIKSSRRNTATTNTSGSPGTIRH